MIPVRYQLSATWQMDIIPSIIYDLAKRTLFISICDTWLYNGVSFW